MQNFGVSMRKRLYISCDLLQLKLIYKRDAKKFWESLELKPIEHCFICGCDVTYENFSAIAPWDNNIVVVCEKSHCYMEFIYRHRNKSLAVRK